MRLVRILPMYPRLKFLSLFTVSVLLCLVSSLGLAGTTPVVLIAQAQAPATQNRKTEADKLLEQGAKQLNEDNEAALQSFQQALTIYREIKDRLREGKALQGVGSAYAYLDNHEKGIEFYQQSLVIAREIKDRELEGKSL